MPTLQLICETDTLEPNVAIPTDPSARARVSITTSACGGTEKAVRFLEHVQGHNSTENILA